MISHSYPKLGKHKMSMRNFVGPQNGTMTRCGNTKWPRWTYEHFVFPQNGALTLCGNTKGPSGFLWNRNSANLFVDSMKTGGGNSRQFFPNPFEFQLSISNQTTISQTWKLWKMRNSQHFFNRSNLTKVANVVAITFAFPVLREIPQTIDHSNPCSSHRTHPAPPSLFFAVLTLPQQRRMSVGIIVAHGQPLEV